MNGFREQKRGRQSKDNFKALIRNDDNIDRYGRMRLWSYFKEHAFIAAGNKILRPNIQIIGSQLLKGYR